MTGNNSITIESHRYYRKKMSVTQNKVDLFGGPIKRENLETRNKADTLQDLGPMLGGIFNAIESNVGAFDNIITKLRWNAVDVPK